MIEAEVLKPVLTLIDEKVKIQDECEKVKRSLMDVLNAPKSLVSIDVNDVRDLFQDGGRIHAYDTSVDASKENRMALIMEQIMSKAKHFEPYNHALVFFFFPAASVGTAVTGYKTLSICLLAWSLDGRSFLIFFSTSS